ncbi:hypothetical protein GCM10023231_03260 [Olivibacter ginsenosidimutans]|uniref:Glycosyltransferase family 61 protein n=1 Tax=Olivibacter ginsenosidimutans TaxID=1176537 RepID=A0ABP9ADQ9_9SPHI
MKDNSPNHFLKKIASLLVRIKYGKLPVAYRYFYRNTYLCKWVQWRYIFKDYFFKKKYKQIAFQGEFAPELEFVLPYAYWHYKNGTLKETAGALYTKEFYFFSPHHEEKFEVRTDEGNYNFDTPRILYSQDYHMKKWLRVPLKEHYQNEVYVFDKPILILANRYNMEWNRPPISYYSLDLLDYIIQHLKATYTIIYNRPAPKNITMDTSDIYDLHEFEWLKQEHPEVLLLEDLYQENKIGARNFNHLQLCVYANASHFISVHGGTAALASYFGGINLILSKEGPEHHFHCFEKLFPQLSGAKILHAKTDDEVKKYVNAHYLKP